jgi:hypothetical protein
VQSAFALLIAIRTVAALDGRFRLQLSADRWVLPNSRFSFFSTHLGAGIDLVSVNNTQLLGAVNRKTIIARLAVCAHLGN